LHFFISPFDLESDLIQNLKIVYEFTILISSIRIQENCLVFQVNSRKKPENSPAEPEILGSNPSGPLL